jgi:transcriptional regulator of heat shock response
LSANFVYNNKVEINNMEKDRKKLILYTIIKEYIKTSQPVSSGLLASQYNLGVSAATIRNEMMALEEEGFIYQPHTSAGRVPAESAYLLYIQAIQEKLPKLKNSEENRLNQSLNDSKFDLRLTAKTLADLANGAVFWAFHKNDLYYTGLSNLFSQPEFKQSNLVCDVSAIIDRMEDIIDNLFDDLKNGLQFKLGTSNPFGPFLGTIILKYRIKNRSGLCGILGPMRLDYSKGAALLDYINKKLK